MIFSRRTIQRALSTVAGRVDRAIAERIAGRLNARDLPTEWEVVYIATLMAHGLVEHEPVLEGGTSRPDIVFRGSDDLAFAADVVTLSDDSADQENPVSDLFSRLSEEHTKFAERVGGLHVEIASANAPTLRRRLALPPKSKLLNIIRLQIRPFFRDIAKAPHATHVHRCHDETDDYDITVRSVPGETLNRLNHQVYTTPTDQRRNVLHNALRDKARQLAASAWSGTRGIVVCDGDCEVLRASSSTRVIREFFHRHREIGFVYVLEVDRGYRAKILAQEHWNPHCPIPNQSALQILLQQVAHGLPPPLQSPVNARYQQDHPRPQDGTFFGGYTLPDDGKIKLSARTVLRLLSGDLAYDEFRRAHSIPLHAELLDQLRSGRRIEAVEIERVVDRDDDWLVFTFGERDAAYGEFNVATDNDSE